MTRLKHFFFNMAQHWDEIISLAIYIKLEDNLLESELIVKSFFDIIENDTSGRFKCILDISILYEIEYKYVFERNNNLKHGMFDILYPINHLRNLALEIAITDWVFLLDADFIPCNNLSYIIQSHYIPAYNNRTKFSNSNQDNPTTVTRTTRTTTPVAFIIPAWEVIENAENRDLFAAPTDVETLLEYEKSNLVQPFHLHHRCKLCHGPTDFKRWRNISNYYLNSGDSNKNVFNLTSFSHKAEFEYGFEPYIITKRRNLHRYDARFRGYGANKQIHLYYLNEIDNYQWVVVPNMFVIHTIHEKSNDRNELRQTKNNQRWLHALINQAKSEIDKKRDCTGTIIK